MNYVLDLFNLSPLLLNLTEAIVLLYVHTTSYIDMQFNEECNSTYVGFVTVSYPGDLVIVIFSFHNTSHYFRNFPLNLGKYKKDAMN